MKNIFKPLTVLMLLSLLYSGCDDISADVEPIAFSDIRLYPDDVYVYNNGSKIQLRLDPTLNDTILTEANLRFAQPQNGTLELMDDGSTYYSPQTDFIGTEHIQYTVCVGSRCLSEVYRVHVEEMPDWSSCQNSLEPEHVVTKKNKRIEIRIHANDTFCFGDNFPFRLFVSSPVHGTYESWQYSGNYKSTVYLYIPPKDFVGEDSFRYLIETQQGQIIEVTSTVTVTE